LDTSAQALAILAIIALLSAAIVQVMLLARHRRRLEDRLGIAHEEIERMRGRLAEATRPSTQFARMRLRESAGSPPPGRGGGDRERPGDHALRD
jgi:hypothetical protein